MTSVIQEVESVTTHNCRSLDQSMIVVQMAIFRQAFSGPNRKPLIRRGLGEMRARATASAPALR